MISKRGIASHSLHIFVFLRHFARGTKMTEHHTILGGKVHVYKRPNSSLWQCSSYFAGKNRRTSTKEESLSKAKEIAEDWYLQLRGKLRAERSKPKKPSAKCPSNICANTTSSRRDNAARSTSKASTGGRQVHLVPFFGHLGISEITAGKIQEYRIHRHEEAMAKLGKPPAHNTMHQEIVTLRQTLKTALRHGWLDRLPDLSEPYRSSPKSRTGHGSHPRNTNKLYKATRKRAQEPKQTRFKWECGATSRLCAVLSQYRTAARRGVATSVPRCHDR